MKRLQIAVGKLLVLGANGNLAVFEWILGFTTVRLSFERDSCNLAPIGGFRRTVLIVTACADSWAL